MHYNDSPLIVRKHYSETPYKGSKSNVEKTEGYQVKFQKKTRGVNVCFSFCYYFKQYAYCCFKFYLYTFVSVVQHIIVLGPRPTDIPLASIHHPKLPPICLLSKEDGHHKAHLQRKTTRLALDPVVRNNQRKVTRKLELFTTARFQAPSRK